MVIASLPNWLWGGKPLDLLATAQLRATKVPGGFRLRTNEAYYHRTRPFLVDDAVVIDKDGREQSGFGSVGEIADAEIEQPILDEMVARGYMSAELAEGELSSLLHQLRVDLSLAAAANLPATCEQSSRAIRTLVVSDVDGSPILSHASVHYIRRSQALVRRVKLISVLVRLEHDDRLAGGDLRQVLADQASGRVTFDSAAGLSDGVYVMDAYIAPLMAALIPGVWGIPVSRMNGTVLISFGRPLSGTRRVPNELLRALSSVGPESGTRFEPFDSQDTPASAISWWSGRLDTMFAVLTDPEAFADSAGRFVPTVALQSLLSVEQVFRRLNSILLSHHDTHARRPAFFAVMDTLMTLNGLSLMTMFDSSHGSAVLNRLESELPKPAQEVLLPAARRGVEALRRMQDGFILREPDGTIRLRQDKTYDITTATAKYVDMLRDATHGFTTVRGGAKQREEVARMVAVHDGKVPHDLGLLAWLYLLDFLNDPKRLRRIVTKSARAAGRPGSSAPRVPAER